MSSYEEWLEWRRKYFDSENGLSNCNDALSDWENEGGSKVVDQMVKDMFMTPMSQADVLALTSGYPKEWAELRSAYDDMVSQTINV